MAYYFTRVDLENALGKQTVHSVFDDDQDGIAESGPVDACRAYGTSEVNSFLRGRYEDLIPVAEADVPDELKFAALDFGLAYAMRRRPDIVRAMGEESWTSFHKTALEKMDRYVTARQRLPATVGAVAATPTNVGSAANSGNADDTTPLARQWDDMGDF